MGLRDIPYNKGHSKSISIKPGDSQVNFLLVTRKLNALLKRQKSILCTMYKKNKKQTQKTCREVGKYDSKNDTNARISNQ